MLAITNPLLLSSVVTRDEISLESLDYLGQIREAIVPWHSTKAGDLIVLAFPTEEHVQVYNGVWSVESIKEVAVYGRDCTTIVRKCSRIRLSRVEIDDD